jgi:hypothetical protein
MKLASILASKNNVLPFLIFLVSLTANGQESDSFTKPQKAYLITSSVGLVAGHAGLYNLWYKDYPQSKFHFINDNQQWLQMDKYGHAFSAYTLSEVGYTTCKSLGFKENRALIYGGLLGLVFQTPIEVFDGFSAEWGASTGDLAANTFGWGLFFTQQKIWKQQIVRMKWSYYHSGYAHLRPNVLGSSFSERLLKDYNGQTYWLSTNISSIFPKSKIPQWLNLAVGFGAEGMIGGSSNLIIDKKTGAVLKDYTATQRYRTYDFSLDLDLSKIKTKSKFLKGAFRYFNWIKIPFPSVQYSNPTGIRFRGLGY